MTAFIGVADIGEIPEAINVPRAGGRKKRALLPHVATDPEAVKDYNLHCILGTNGECSGRRCPFESPELAPLCKKRKIVFEAKVRTKYASISDERGEVAVQLYFVEALEETDMITVAGARSFPQRLDLATKYFLKGMVANTLVLPAKIS
jgi:hypothetical protein